MCKISVKKAMVRQPQTVSIPVTLVTHQVTDSFKTLVLNHKCLSGDAPRYLRDLIVIVQAPRPRLRSCESQHLLGPKTESIIFTARSFSVALPTLWNQLQSAIKDILMYLHLRNISKHIFLNLHLVIYNSLPMDNNPTGQKLILIVLILR